LRTFFTSDVFLVWLGLAGVQGHAGCLQLPLAALKSHISHTLELQGKDEQLSNYQFSLFLTQRSCTTRNISPTTQRPRVQLICVVLGIAIQKANIIASPLVPPQRAVPPPSVKGS
jgi:hypothetical protein